MEITPMIRKIMLVTIMLVTIMKPEPMPFLTSSNSRIIPIRALDAY